jgi:hypothetical protein
VLDDSTAEFITKSEISHYDMMTQNVYQIERLSKFRKSYPMSDAVYFIAPTSDSIGHLVSDFTSDEKGMRKLPNGGMIDYE